MAYRDRAQGFGFVYLDVKKVLALAAALRTTTSDTLELDTSDKRAAMQHLRESGEKLRQLDDELAQIISEPKPITFK